MRVRLHGPAGEFVLAEGDNLLGRAVDCSLMVNDPRLSRRHARFTQLGAVLRVADLGSMNGVLVNGIRIPAPTVLKDHDVVVCGPCRFTCEIDPAGKPQTRVVTTSLGAAETDTEPLEGMAAAATQPDPPRPLGRILDSKIAAAVGTTRTGQPVAKDDGGSDNLPPDDQPDSRTTSALSNRPSEAHPSSSPSRQPKHQTTDITPQANHIRGDSALQPQVSAVANRRGRMIAGFADGLTLVVLCAVLALPIAGIGYVVALHARGVEIVDGLPRLPALVGSVPAAWSDLLTSLVASGAWTRAHELIPALTEARHTAPFAILFGTATILSLVTVLAFVLQLVAATVLHGGPVWHRRFQLEIVAMNDGAYPSWPRAALRWILAACLWPLAPFAVTAGKRSLHDLLSGCDVRRRAT